MRDQPQRRRNTSFATRSEEIEGLRELLAAESAKIRALQDIGAASGSILNLDELLALVVSRITQVMEADRTTIYLLEDDGKHLVSRVAEGSERHEIRLALGEGFAGWVVRNGQPLNTIDAYADPRFDPEWDRRTGYRTRTVLCVPMKNRLGRPIGAIQVLNKSYGNFTGDDEAMLSALASQASVTIESGKFFVAPAAPFCP